MRSTFQAKRRKMLAKRRDPEAYEMRESTSDLHDSNGHQTNKNESIRAALQHTSALFQEEKAARKGLETKLEQTYHRFLRRQDEFRQLLQQSIPYVEKQKAPTYSTAELARLHEQFVAFFEKTNQQVDRALQDEGRDMIDLMQRKAKMITDHMEEQMEVNRRLISVDYKQIQREIKEMLDLSNSVLKQNESFRSQINMLKFRNSMLKEEKELLLHEMMHCRQLLSRMATQLKEKYKRDDKMWQDLDRMRQEREGVIRQYIELEEQRKQRDIVGRGIVLEQFTDNQSNVSKAKAETRPRTNTQPNKQQHRSSHTYTRARTNLKTDTIESININSRQRRVSTTTDIRGRSTVSKWNFKSKRHIEGISLADSRVMSQDPCRTVNQLQDALRREKKRCGELSKELNQLRRCQRQMDTWLRGTLVSQQGGLAQALGSNAHGQRIYGLLKELERRMMRTQNPAFNSGFTDLSDLLKQFDG